MARPALLLPIAMAVLAGLVLLTLAGEGTDPLPGDLSSAVGAGDQPLVAAHLARGADPSAVDRNGLTPLMRAVARDDPVLVALLLDAGAAPDQVGATGLAPIHVAAELDAGAALDVLLDKGADVTLRTRSGMAALHVAAMAGSADAIGRLLAAGVDPDQPSAVTTQGHGYPRDRGTTALGLAAWADQPAAVAALLDAGAPVDAPSTSGHTPLLMAVFGGARPELVGRLLDAGADVAVTADCTRGCAHGRLDVLGWAQALDRDRLVPLLTPPVPAGDRPDGPRPGAS